MKSPKSQSSNARSGKNFIGLIIILIGALLLVERLIPTLHLDWLFSWPMFLVIIGLLVGSKSKFEDPTGYILIGTGAFFLINNEFDFRIGRLIWPVILIFVGFWLLKGRSRRHKFQNPVSGLPPDDMVWDKRVDVEKDMADQPLDPDAESEPSFEENTSFKEDFIDSTSIFGDTKHYIVSQQFLGGDIVNIMGGATINLMHADLKGPATLEVVQLFGGTTIIAPAHWIIQPEMASIFGGTEDKRFHTPAKPDRTKILYLKGTSIFGGITIKSY